ncbi:hypothetical protein [Cognatiyoonia sp. IB215182]|uniref:hypothetical protein n=1 Tax=Cognatiyoonia sp. IB215182 TaxID=3097353 RepID=UPI002A0D37FD|nr:hypothetical protein [Cognatiyoonia sp. IB215182]MDX8355406.1 hypothetical protein [Cognatiyoonia sp. IB215182]
MTCIRPTALAACVVLGHLVPLGLSAETVPIEAIARQAYPNEIFHSKLGFYYVLDANPGLAWILNENGEFDTLMAYSKADDVFNVIEDGKWVFEIPVDSQASQIQWSFSNDPEFPGTRPFLQQIVGQELTVPVGDFIPAGARFEAEFTMSTPEGVYFTWYPDDRADGIFVTNLETNDERHVLIADLKPAVGWTGE